jgi:hypothetical protein
MNKSDLTRMIINLVLAAVGGWFVKKGIDEKSLTALLEAAVPLGLAILEGYAHRHGLLLSWPPPDPPVDRSSAKLPAIALPFAALLMLGNVGCVNSPAFQWGVEQGATTIVSRAETYAKGDTSIDDATRADRLSKVAALRTATTVKAAITLPAVEAAWSAVRPFYVAYIDSDVELQSLPMTLALRRKTIELFDLLINEERNRRRIFEIPAG